MMLGVDGLETEVARAPLDHGEFPGKARGGGREIGVLAAGTRRARLGRRQDEIDDRDLSAAPGPGPGELHGGVVLVDDPGGTRGRVGDEVRGRELMEDVRREGLLADIPIVAVLRQLALDVRDGVEVALCPGGAGAVVPRCVGDHLQLAQMLADPGRAGADRDRVLQGLRVRRGGTLCRGWRADHREGDDEQAEHASASMHEVSSSGGLATLSRSRPWV